MIYNESRLYYLQLGVLMFVSSYSTFIDTSATKRVQNDKNNLERKPKESFSKQLIETTGKDVILSKNLPLNYISNYKALSNKQAIEQQLQGRDKREIKAKIKFTKLSAQSSAQVSYADNSKMFSLRVPPKLTLDQTPKLNRKLPVAALKTQESTLKNLMVNTYIANENYYRITAA